MEFLMPYVVLLFALSGLGLLARNINGCGIVVSMGSSIIPQSWAKGEVHYSVSFIDEGFMGLNITA